MYLLSEEFRWDLDIEATNVQAVDMPTLELNRKVKGAVLFTIGSAVLTYKLLLDRRKLVRCKGALVHCTSL